jgi:hypothetical protein
MAKGIIKRKDGTNENPSKENAVIAVLKAVTLAVPILFRILELNILDKTVQPEMRKVITLTASTGIFSSLCIAGQAEPISESGTPRPINAI